MSANKKITPIVGRAVEKPQAGAVTPLEMLNRAVQSGADIAVLEKLMALEERWRAGQARMAFDIAISAAKSQIKPIKKNKHVKYPSKDKDKGPTDYWHEDLAQIARTIDPILAEHGLSYRYRTAQANGAVTVTCILSHRDGHFEETPLSSAPDKSGGKNDIQAIGSAVSYLQRYTLKVALGLAAAQDDDGRKTEPLPATLTSEQVETLTSLLKDTETEAENFLGYLRQQTKLELPTLHDIPAPLYANAVKKLETKKKVMEDAANSGM